MDGRSCTSSFSLETSSQLGDWTIMFMPPLLILTVDCTRNFHIKQKLSSPKMVPKLCRWLL